MKNNINKAINFIRDQQQIDGSFLSLSSPDKNSFVKSKKYNSVFPSSLILSCLTLNKESKEIKNNLVNFLLSQKSEYWSFNYWKRNSKENTKLIYQAGAKSIISTNSILHSSNQLDLSSLIANVLTVDTSK